MAFDIAAIQQLYGANTTFHSGNDSYVLPDSNVAGTYYTCIWDVGGSDTISYFGSKNCTINLNAASLDNAPNGGGDISSAAGIYGGFTIANGVLIENARGGSGIDTIIGNSADNVLDGGAGADSMAGGAGNDTYVVDNASDAITENAGAGTDTVQASVRARKRINES